MFPHTTDNALAGLDQALYALSKTRAALAARDPA